MRRGARALIMILPAFGAPALAADATVEYVCPDHRLEATFRSPPADPGSAELFFPQSGQRLMLPQVPAADGGRYAAGDVEFWIKGREARLTKDGTTTTCEATS